VLGRGTRRGPDEVREEEELVVRAGRERGRCGAVVEEEDVGRTRVRVGCFPASADDERTLEGPVVGPAVLVNACLDDSGLGAATVGFSAACERVGPEAPREEVGRTSVREGPRSRSEVLLEAEAVLEWVGRFAFSAWFDAAAREATDFIFGSVLLEPWFAWAVVVLISRYLRIVGVRGEVNLHETSESRSTKDRL
jgi:hypothetical protein